MLGVCRCGRHGGGCQRNRDAEDRTLTERRHDLDRAAHEVEVAFGQCQTQSGATLPGSFLGLVEGLEQSRLICRGDAAPRIDELEAHPGAREPDHPQGHAALVGVCDGIRHQVDQHLTELRLVAPHESWAGMIPVNFQTEVLFLAPTAEHVRDPIDQACQIEVGHLEFHASGLDLGEVEDAVDHGEEMLTAALDGLDEPALFGGQIVRAVEELGVAEDGVHGGADLVAHVRQEGALGAVGGLGGLLSLFQGTVPLDQGRVALAAMFPGEAQRSQATERRNAESADQSDLGIVGADGEGDLGRERDVHILVHGPHHELVIAVRQVVVGDLALIQSLFVRLMADQLTAVGQGIGVRAEAGPLKFEEHSARFPSQYNRLIGVQPPIRGHAGEANLWGSGVGAVMRESGVRADPEASVRILRQGGDLIPRQTVL